jgi:hypothetical protein
VLSIQQVVEKRRERSRGKANEAKKRRLKDVKEYFEPDFHAASDKRSSFSTTCLVSSRSVSGQTLPVLF